MIEMEHDTNLNHWATNITPNLSLYDCPLMHEHATATHILGT